MAKSFSSRPRITHLSLNRMSGPTPPYVLNARFPILLVGADCNMEGPFAALIVQEGSKMLGLRDKYFSGDPDVVTSPVLILGTLNWFEKFHSRDMPLSLNNSSKESRDFKQPIKRLPLYVLNVHYCCPCPSGSVAIRHHAASFEPIRVQLSLAQIPEAEFTPENGRHPLSLLAFIFAFICQSRSELQGPRSLILVRLLVASIYTDFWAKLFQLSHPWFAPYEES